MKFNKTAILIMSLLFASLGSNCQDSLPVRSLDFYLEKGIANSPLLKENLNATELNRIDSLINIAASKPFVQAVSQYLYAPHGEKAGYDENITNGGQYTGLLQISRNIFYRRNLKIQNQLNSALKDSIQNTIRINENDLRKGITDLYLISYLDYSQMEIFRNLFRLFSEQNELLKDLLRSAYFTQADYLAFRLDMQQSEIDWRTSKVQYLQDLLALNILCNINDTSLVKLDDPKLLPKPVFSFQNNPYLVRFRLDSIIVERNRRMIDIFYRPKLDLSIDGGFNAIRASNIRRNFGFGVFLDFSIPIYNGHQRRFQYQKFRIDQLTIANYRNQYTIRLSLKMKTLNEQLKVTQELLDLMKTQNVDVENLLTLSKIRLYGGDISAIDYLLIVQRYLNTKLNMAKLKVQQYSLINESNYRIW